MSERIARLRDAVRADLRVLSALAAPLDDAVDDALREGLVFLSDRFPPATVRVTITDEALSGDLLDVGLLVAGYRQLVTFAWPVGDAPMPYTPVGLSGLLFPVGCAPYVGSQAEICYRPLLTVEGFDGAASTTLNVAWDWAWQKAVVWAWLNGQLQYARMMGADIPDRDKGLPAAVKRALEAAEAAVRSVGGPVAPVSWGRMGL